MCEDRKGSHSRLPRAAPADEERQNYCLRSINMLSQSLEQFNAQAVSSVARQKAPVRSASLPDFKNDRQRVSRAVVGGCTDGLQSCLACLGQLRTTRQYERTCPIDFDQSGALNFTYSYTMQCLPMRAALLNAAQGTPSYSTREDATMKNQQLKDFEKNAEETVEQTAERVRGAADNYFSFLHQTIASFPTGGTEFGEKLKTCAEENVEAMSTYVHNLSQAKDLQEVIRIQLGFVQSQFNAFGEQAKTLGAACAKAAADAANKPFQKVV